MIWNAADWNSGPTRVRESVFRLDPDEALSDLWETLKRRQIFPVAEDEMRRSVARQAVAHGDSRANEQTFGSENSPKQTDLSSAPEPSPDHEGSLSLNLPLQLSHPEPTPTSADGVGWLAPYTEWRPVAAAHDPRTAEQAQLVDLLAEVVECEGPVVAIRAYRLINRASGSRKLTTPARKALNRACAAAVRTGVVTATNPLECEGQAQLVLRGPSRPDIILRERGPRELDELPPDEIAAMLGSSVRALRHWSRRRLRGGCLKDSGGCASHET